MRSSVLVGLLAVFVVSSVPGSAAEAQGPQRQCRQQWSDLASLHAENGNPEGPVPDLNARWEATYDTASAYADTATEDDCGDLIATFAATWGDLESFQYDLYRYDPLGRLAIAERDRQHALHLNHVKHLSEQLERQFRIARRQAPRAAHDFAGGLASAATVEVTDQTAVDSVLTGLRSAARASHHQQVLNQALRVIGNAELDEE